MKKTIYLLICISGIILNACGGKTGKTGVSETPAFNPYVSAFTSGNIARTDKVYVVFSEPVETGKISAERIGSLAKIKPSVAGQWAFEDEQTLVFRPEKEFSRDTRYDATIDLSEWFDAQGEYKNFSFGFATYPVAIRASLESISVANDDDNTYDLSVLMFTPDNEKAEDVESLISFSEKIDAAWEHTPGGKQHALTLRNVKAAEKQRAIEIKVGKNKLGVPRETILGINIPAADDFSVYGVDYISDPQQYVEVTFTETLDDKQNMRGLAYIQDNGSETVTVEGNKLRLYPDADKTGQLAVILTGAIRSKKGKTLEEDKIYNVEVKSMLPEVKFIGNGVIMPLSNQLTIPFQSVYLRGVTVRVIRIMENNIGQFFQGNNLDGEYDLMRVGRPVARKTIFLDENGTDVSKWNTYALDLRTIMEPEPGAIYRIELSFTKDLSAYPCGGDQQQKTTAQIIADDEIKFREELDRFDGGGYYYYYDEYDDWYSYDYKERDNPCSGSYYRNRTVGRNVLATNLGLIATMGEDNKMTVLVHNILDTKPERGVSVTAYSFQHQQLGSSLTDDKGQAVISFGSGRPYYITASLGSQKSYLRVDAGSALSLSSFDVSGEVVQKGLKGFIYGERGVWRPGDTIHLGFMLNDRENKLPANHPVVMELYTPLGQLYTRKTQTNNEMGLYVFDFPTEKDAITGAWHVTARVGGATFTKSLRVETIKPNRLKIGFDLPDKTLLRGQLTEVPMHVEWLQGATARDLKYEIETSFTASTTFFKGYEGFIFDDPSKKFSGTDPNMISGTTNENGNATVGLRFDSGEDAPGMLTANMVIRVYEESGDFSIDAARASYSPYRIYAGIKSPQKENTQLNTGTQHTFEIATVDYTGAVKADIPVEVDVYKVQWYWWWSSGENMLANYISNTYNEPVKNLKIKTGPNGKATFQLNFTNSEWGTYFIRVKDSSGGQSSGVMAYFDWPSIYGRRDAEGGEAASTITIKTDKDTYAPGEKIRVTFPSTDGSRAIISIENGTTVLSISEYECKGKETTLSIEATEDMQPNAYIYITLLQPHGAMRNDLPIRMYGVVPVTVTSPQSRLTPVITMPDEIRPETKYDITVSERNGREMAYSIAVVDEGLLDLTRFKTPDPWSAFNAREALGVNTWDLYNYVAGAYGGRIEQVFSIGGDDQLAGGQKAIVNRFAPVVVFDGPYRLKKGEKKRHMLDMPNYNGRVRVMVVAGNGDAYGDAQKSVLVRKPLMLLGTLPRVIGTGEEMVVPVTVFAMKDGMGDVKVTIKTSDNLAITGDPTQTVSLNKTGDKIARFRIRVKDTSGSARVAITASAKGETAEYATDIEIRSVRRPQIKVEQITLQPGGGWKGEIKMPGAAGTNSLTLEMSDVRPVNLTSRLGYLLGYPHGCVEQIVSKAFPQLYVEGFASLTKAQESAAKEAIKEVIRRMRSYQTPEGYFSYWPGGSDYNAWASVYATQFLLEAEAKGYLIPDALKRNALTALRRTARDWKAERSPYLQSEMMTQAYRLYVLTLAQSTELGAMNRLKESDPDDISRWLLAAAYANAGRPDVARELISKTTNAGKKYDEYDRTFGSETRDKAIKLITLTLLGNAKEAAPIANEISNELASDEWMSTQTSAFALVALSQYMDKYKTSGEMKFSYKIYGKGENISTPMNVWSETLLENAPANTILEMNNSGASVLFASVITEGVPQQGEEQAYANGITISVEYKDMNGKRIDAASLAQGTNFTADVTLRNPSPRAYDNLVLTQIFPAGWEILNTRFLNGNDPEGISTSVINYQDIRDDRVYSYIDRLASGRQVTVSINLTAVYPGKFYLPPVYCEAMYDNLIRANTRGTMVSVE